MASFEVIGIDRIIKNLEEKSNIPDKVKAKYVHEAADVVLLHMKIDAPRADEEEDSTYSWRNLDKVDGRGAKGYLYIDIGINANNWEGTRGLWFQNWNGVHSSGEHLLWMEKSFKESSKLAKKIIKDGLSKELGL